MRDIVDSFVEGKYKTALDLLETHSVSRPGPACLRLPSVARLVNDFLQLADRVGSPSLPLQSRHLLTPHLAPHLSNLTASVRRKALIQYFTPFESVKLSRMGAAFGMKEDEVLKLVIELVGSGEIDGRIDLPNKVSIACYVRLCPPDRS